MPATSSTITPPASLRSERARLQLGIVSGFISESLSDFIGIPNSRAVLYFSGSIEIYVACVERKNVGNELALLSFDDISGFVKVPEACYCCSREETWHAPS